MDTPIARGARMALTVLLLLVTLLATAPAHPAAATTLGVTTTADTFDVVGKNCGNVLISNLPGGGDGKISLREAICAANNTAGADTIIFTLPGAAPWVLTLASTLPTITTNLTLYGGSTPTITIQGTNTFPLVLVNAPGLAVVLSQLTLSKGKATVVPGGNLRSIGGDLTLADVRLTNGTAANGWGGGGAYLSNGTIGLTDVIVSGNSAPGSSIYQTGAGLDIDEYWGNTTVGIWNSSIVGNTATANNGGGLAIVRDSGVAGRTLVVSLTTTTVGTPAQPNVVANGAGGGIYNQGGTLTLTNSTVANNNAGSGGGLALYNGVDFGSVSATLSGTTVSGNRASGSGGGISAVNAAAVGGGASVTATNSTLSGNSAGLSGGGLLVSSVSPLGSTAATLRFATVTNNTADSTNNGVGTGGGLKGLGASGSVSVLSSIVAGNRRGQTAADDCAGAVVSQGYNLWGVVPGCPNSHLLHDQNLTGLGLDIGQVLTSLADNGGPTSTHALVDFSPAEDHGDPTTCGIAAPNGAGGVDQRGTPRNDGHCDVGATEFIPVILTLTIIVDGPAESGTTNPAAGTYKFHSAQVVTLNAIPAPWANFDHWSAWGQYLDYHETITFAVTQDVQVHAEFSGVHIHQVATTAQQMPGIAHWVE